MKSLKTLPVTRYGEFDPMKALTASKKSISKIEEEQALLIRSDNPKLVAEKIANTTKISGFSLNPLPNQIITDVYLNTPHKDIKSSLRIRNFNDEDYITFKSKNYSTSSDQIRREIEVKWPWETPSIWEVVELFQLEITQERITNRIIRDIRNMSGISVAELAIDEVTYLFDQKVKFFEIEIEMNHATKHNCKLDTIVDLFLGKFPELEKWKNSKFSTGTALELALSINTDDEGLVTDESFDSLSTFLELLT